MKVTPKPPKGYFKVRAGRRFRRNDLEPQFNHQRHSETSADDSFSPQWASFDWKPLDRESGVDDWRVEKDEFIIRKRKKR